MPTLDPPPEAVDPQRCSLNPEQLLTAALQQGAEAVEVFQSRALTRPVSFEANRLKQIEVAQTEGTALRLWRDGRPGLAVAYGAVDPQILVERALALTALNDPEAIELAPASPHAFPDLGQSVPLETLVGWGQQATSLIRDAYPDVQCASGWEWEAETTRLLNSNGLDCHYTDITLSADLNAEWVRGDDFLCVMEAQTERGNLDPVRLARQVIQRLQWAERNVVPLQGQVPVLFTAKAADMLWGTFQAALNGKQVLEQASPWSDRLGRVVTHQSLTCSQDPTLGPYSSPFDDEGTPTRSLPLIQDGVLQLFYTDRASGRRLGCGSTGNGFRPGLGSYPNPSLVNWVVEPGDQPLATLISGLKDGLMVDQILGGGAGISGEFSVNVDLGYRVRRGEIVGRVKDTMIAGNVYDVLKSLVALGNDRDWHGHCYTPSVLVEGITVIGKR